MADSGDEGYDFDELYDGDVAEAYCMSCRQVTEMEDPEPIWTRRGAPGTRGTCAICGTTVFRMGMTDAHDHVVRPAAEQLAGLARGKVSARSRTCITYINHCVADAEFAEILAEELGRIGIATWLAPAETEHVHWATGVHPVLAEAAAMVVVLTPLAVKATNVADALHYYLGTRKPVYIAQLAPIEVPESLRRKPRFDFAGDEFRQQFRLLAQALSEV